MLHTYISKGYFRIILYNIDLLTESLLCPLEILFQIFQKSKHGTEEYPAH